jgi:hypothetical protein
MMDDFEKQLQGALNRKEPSPFFEARVLGAVKRQARERRASVRKWWATAVAAMLIVVAGSAWQHQRSEQAREQAAGKEAKARLELALRITSVKLQKISQKVEGI